MSIKKLLLAGLIGIGIILCLIAWSPWNSWRYRGDAKFSDGGFFAYPRYVLTFSEMPLYKDGEYQFRFKGVPSEEMTLMLYVKGSDGRMAERPRLTNLPASIDAALTDTHGKHVCRASGRPKDSNEDGIWVLMSGAEAAYWHWQCNDILMRSNESYNLVIRVSSAGQAAEKVVVIPKLQGGGLELP